MLSKLFGWRRAKDPVCGAWVQPEAAPTYRFVGDAYYFCSERCRERFQALPARYLELPVKLPESSATGGGCC